jgi:hypothetical protein
LIPVMEKCCVFFEVNTEFLNIIYMSFALQRVNHSLYWGLKLEQTHIWKNGRKCLCNKMNFHTVSATMCQVWSVTHFRHSNMSVIWSSAVRMISRRKWNYWENYLHLNHFVCHKYHVDCFGIWSGPSWGEAGVKNIYVSN